VDQAQDLPDGGVRFVSDNPVFVAWGDMVTEVKSAFDGDPSAGGATGDRAANDKPSTVRVALGIGCSSHATDDEMRAVIAEALAGPDDLPGGAPPGTDARPDVVATIDRRVTHHAVTTAAGQRPLLGFPPLLLRAVDVANPSVAVDDAVGTPSVAEAAALLAAGPGARLVVTKRSGVTATAAIATAPRPLPRQCARPTPLSATAPTSTPPDPFSGPTNSWCGPTWARRPTGPGPPSPWPGPDGAWPWCRRATPAPSPWPR
jgi:hypothetical protein